MINLLPQEEIRQLRAARSNVLLFRYNILLVGAVVFLIIAVGITYIQLTRAKTIAEESIDLNKARSSNFIPVENQAKEFRTNLGTAKQILDREVTYTNVILAIAKLLPKDVILDDLSLDAQTFGTPTTLVAHAKSYEAALALKESFQTSKIFSDVHFESVATDDDGSTPDYPVTVSLNVTIIKGTAK